MNPRDVLACPRCRTPLVEEGVRLKCATCGTGYRIDNGLVVFDELESSHGEFTHEEMNELLERASAEGWRSALETYAMPRRPRVIKLILDDRRINLIRSLMTTASGEGGDSGSLGTVLDLGCGYGGVSLQLSEVASRVVSLDGSRDRVAFLNIARNQEGKENIQPVCHNGILTLPFADAQFDLVVMIGVFEYLPLSVEGVATRAAHLKCLEEFRRILKPGGKLLIASKNRFGWQYLKGAADHSNIRFAPALPQWLADAISRVRFGKPYRVINYSPAGYRRLMLDGGFEDVSLSWSAPSYQTPRHVIPIDRDCSDAMGALDDDYFTPRRRRMFSLLEKMGLLRRIVPFVNVLASKPGD